MLPVLCDDRPEGGVESVCQFAMYVRAVVRKRSRSINMLCLALFLLLLTPAQSYWDKEVVCPSVCKCRLEHTTETSIHRFIPKDEDIDNARAVPEAIVLESNDAFYADDDGDVGAAANDRSAVVRSAMCVIQAEATVQEVLQQLPKDVGAITLIQATNSGNKSMRISDLRIFSELRILELRSAQTQAHVFHVDIDVALEHVEYVNFERVLVRTAPERWHQLENETPVFDEYPQRNGGDDADGHARPALTFLERRTADVLPYSTYKESLGGAAAGLSFVGFSRLVLLRLHECELHHIHREMFDGLTRLQYLLLEKNHLQFVSAFAFYGAPNLRSLSLAHNQLLNIEITDLAGLLELEYLDLSHNKFTQLSELSLPPFPKLKLCNLADNPITVVFPNTFEVMNTTYALIVGGLDEPMTLQSNSFLGLNLLMSLKLHRLDIKLFERDILRGMPNLQVLVMTGSIAEIQYDAFLEVVNLDTLIVSGCNVSRVSVDAFIGLDKLRVLDLSRNALDALPPGVFDVLPTLSELYLHANRLSTLPPHLFADVPARLIRLNDNPWHCTCDMSDWKPLIVNRIKQKTIRACESTMDKQGFACHEDVPEVYYKYVYENSVAPKCHTPLKFYNWSVFHVMRRQFKCVDFKPKMKKRMRKKTMDNDHIAGTAVVVTAQASVENDDELIDMQQQLEKFQRKAQRDAKLRKTIANRDFVNEPNNEINLL